MHKIRAIHKIPGTVGGFEGFDAGDHLTLTSTIHAELQKLAPDTYHNLTKEQIEETALRVAKELCEDEIKIYWNKWSEDRVSFTLYPAATSYAPIFAPGCTITIV
jgi:hypothetical protein